VKLWGFILLELVAVGSVSGLVVHGVHHRAGGAEVQVARSGAGSLLPEPEAPSAAVGAREPNAAVAAHENDPPLVEVTTSRVGTFLGMKDEILIDHIKNAPVAEARLNKGGSSISFRLTFTDGTRAAFKPLQNNPQTVPRKEVAAYRIDRLLGMNAVPPAAMRTLHRDDLVGKLPDDAKFLATRIDAETVFDDEGFTRGEVSYWIPVIADSHLDTLESVLAWWKWMTIGEEIPPEKLGLMAQLSSLLVFDLVTNNSDRFSGGNMMTSPDGRTLYFMDNTFGFQVEPEGHLKCRTYLSRTQKFSRRLIGALRALDARAIQRALAGDPGVLTDEEIGAVMARRDWVLRYVDGLSARFGESQVLVFP
jgi:hypothetical protein